MEEEKGESATRIASQHFAEEIYAMVDHEKLELNTEMQSEIFRRLAESTRALQTFNDFSAKHFQSIGTELEKKTKVLKELQKDLEIVHKKIRSIKIIIEKSFPQQYSIALKQIDPLNLEGEDD